MGTILIVDDNTSVIGILKETLTGMGHSILSETNGSAAIGTATRHKPDLIILDYDLGLSKVTGEETCAILRNMLPHAIIIIISGIADRQDISDILRSCANKFVSKPYSPMYLIQLVEQYLG